MSLDKANARKNIKLDPELLKAFKALALAKGYPRLMDYIRAISKDYMK